MEQKENRREKELDAARDQFIRSVLFAAASESVPVVSIKVSALAQNELLEEVQRGGKLTSEAQQRYDEGKGTGKSDLSGGL